MKSGLINSSSDRNDNQPDNYNSAFSSSQLTVLPESLPAPSNSSTATLTDRESVKGSYKHGKDDHTTESYLLDSFDDTLGDKSYYENAFESCSLGLSPEYVTIPRNDILDYHDHIVSRTIPQARAILIAAVEEHKGDPCLTHNKLEYLKKILEDTDPTSSSPSKAMCLTYTLKFEAFLIHDWSIYPEVRAVTRPFDEAEEDCESFRVYFLGILWSCLGAAMDTFFATRYPSISLDAGSILIMLVYSGKCFSKLPKIYIPLFYRGRRLCINSGKPWSFKEQMLATLAMSCAVGSPYSLKAIISQQNPHFFGIEKALNFWYILLLTGAANFMGFGIAGIMRTFLVYPTRCIWYNVLPTIAVNRALINKEQRVNTNGWKLTGAEFFGMFAAISFCWFWATDYLFQVLSFFDWPAWIAPQNVPLQAITGCINGLGFNPINTFDWNNIGAVSVMTPVYAHLMSFTGMLLSMLAIIVLWFGNISWTAYMPINSTTLHANDGTPFDVRKIIDIPGYKINEEKYQKYSPPFWSAGSLINEGGYLMMYTGMIVYTILNYSGQICRAVVLLKQNILANLRRKGANAGLQAYNDRFSRAMRKYPEVPEWWFLLVMVISIGVAIAMVEFYTFTSTPVWTIFFAIGVSTLFTIPFGYLHSTTCIHFDNNTLFEMVIGLALPGNANALIVSKVFAANFFSQSSSFITNQVQSHYTGISPRALFRAQLATLAASVVVKSLLTYWVISPSGIPDLCAANNPDKFNCLHQRSYFNAAIQWGIISPQRVLGKLYPMLKYCFIAGAVYPIPFWLLRKYLPRYTTKFNWILHNFHEMAMLAGVSWAPKSMQYVIGVTYVNLFFNWYIKKRYPKWWQKYTYTFGHAMDVGVGYSGLIIFFATEYKRELALNWWGNNKPFEVGDALGITLKKISPERGYFGPEKGRYP